MSDNDFIRRGDAARAVALCSAESDSPNAHFVCRQAVNAIRAIPAADAKEAEAYAEELEAKLAKAVEALGHIVDLAEDSDECVANRARATLAEIKGENQDGQ